MKVPVRLVHALGVLFFLSGLSMVLWAPHKPALVLIVDSGVLGVVATLLFTWPSKPDE